VLSSLPLIFLNESCYMYIQRWSTSCFTFRELIESQALLTFAEILPFIRINFRLAWSWLSFAFYPRTFLCSGVFMMTKWIGFESVTTVIECKQKMLLSWNRVFVAKSHWGVSELWWLWHLASLLTLINKSLFVNNLHIFFCISLTFIGKWYLET